MAFVIYILQVEYQILTKIKPGSRTHARKYFVEAIRGNKDFDDQGINDYLLKLSARTNNTLLKDLDFIEIKNTIQTTLNKTV